MHILQATQQLLLAKIACDGASRAMQGAVPSQDKATTRLMLPDTAVMQGRQSPLQLSQH